MKVTRRQVVNAVSDGTGLQPEDLAALAVAAAAVVGVLTVLRVMDFVSRHLSPGRR